VVIASLPFTMKQQIGLVPGAHTSTRTFGVRVRELRWLVPIGRVLLASIFIVSSLSHFSNTTIAYAQSMGVPGAGFLVPMAGLMAGIGGISVLLGYETRWGALLLVLFLVPVTVVMHRFWDVADPEMAMLQRIHFMKNVTMLGGVLLVLYWGGGPISIDARRRSRMAETAADQDAAKA
jgi:putative oxidoreductase